jgi:hypothetical protein
MGVEIFSTKSNPSINKLGDLIFVTSMEHVSEIIAIKASVLLQ